MNKDDMWMKEEVDVIEKKKNEVINEKGDLVKYE